MIFRKLCLAGLLLAVFGPALRALDPLRLPSQYHSTEWNMTHGLPYTAVRTVYQPADGYLLLATRVGLTRFDGVHFSTISNLDDGERLKEPTDLVEDSRGRLWVGTFNGVVWRVDGRWARLPLGPELDQVAICGLLPDGDGILVAGTEKVFRWERGTLTPVASGSFSYSYKSLRRTRTGDILVAGHNAVLRLAKGDLSRQTVISSEIPTTTEIRDAVETADGTVWIGTADGLYEVAQGHTRRLPELNAQRIGVVRSLHVDHDDNLWIGTPNGLLRLRRNRLEPVLINGDETLSQILAMTEDREGNLWCGTDAGLLRLRDVKVVNLTTRDGLPVNSIQNIERDAQGVKWICTRDGGLLRIEGDQRRILGTKTGLSGDAPMAHCLDSAGNFWVAYYGSGVDRIAPDGTITRHPEVHGYPSAIIEAAPGEIWVTALTPNSFYQLRDGVFTPSTEFKDLMPRCVFRDSRGRCWTAWNNGHAVWENGRWTHYPLSPGQEPGNPAVFREHADGSIWLLRNGPTLERFTDTTHERLRLPAIGGGLSYGMLVREDEALFSLRNCIVRIKLAALDAAWAGRKGELPYLSYNEADGMRSPAPNGNSPSCIADMGPEGIWQATTRGIAIIHTERIRPNTLPPPVVIEAVVADRHEIALAPEIRVPPGRGELQLRFTALSLTNSVHNRFRYKLEGFDRDWTEADTRREANYGGLPPGSYRFHVIACNSDGLWNEQGASCRLVIAPRFHQRWWFWPATAAALLGLFAALLRQRTRSLQRRQAALQSLIAERTSELHGVNVRLQSTVRELEAFSYSVSHDLRAPLRNICGFAELLRKQLADQLGPDPKRQLDIVSAEARRLDQLIDSLLQFSRLSRTELQHRRCNLAEVVAAVREELAPTQGDRPVEWRIGTLPVVQGDPTLLRQVFANLLGNALKFTRGRAPAVIEVGIESTAAAAGDSGEHVILVRDNGAGFDPRYTEKLFGVFQRLHSAKEFEGVGIGLANVQRIVARHGGRVWAEGAPGKGATFYVAIPVA